MKHVLTDMQNAPAAWPFAKPVNKDEVADYYLLVQEPMGSSSLFFFLSFLDRNSS
jgi:histone acetyltransferase